MAMCPPRRPSRGPYRGPMCRRGATPPSPALLGLPPPPPVTGAGIIADPPEVNTPARCYSPPPAPAGTVVLPPTPWGAPRDGGCSNAAPPCAPCMTCMPGPRAHRTGSAWGAAAAPPFFPLPAAPSSVGGGGLGLSLTPCDCPWRGVLPRPSGGRRRRGPPRAVPCGVGVCRRLLSPPLKKSPLPLGGGLCPPRGPGPPRTINEG